MDVAATMNNLGIVYRKLGKFKEALEYYEKSLGIKIKVFNGQDHTDVAVSKLNMASLLEVVHMLNNPRNKEWSPPTRVAQAGCQSVQKSRLGITGCPS
jgi:tetratricopeptide (TPR) repeat protein